MPPERRRECEKLKGLQRYNVKSVEGNGLKRQLLSARPRWAEKIVKHDREQLGKATTVDEYLARLSEEKRKALQQVRQAIRAAAPKAEECISYGVPSFRLNGKFLVAIGATAKHCSFYLGSTVQRHKTELKSYDTSKGTIRFPASRPLPSGLVGRLVRARMAEKGRESET
jgi:uncharacterized protein YdhG (YjbR/CyaY superfamily)